MLSVRMPHGKRPRVIAVAMKQPISSHANHLTVCVCDAHIRFFVVLKLAN